MEEGGGLMRTVVFSNIVLALCFVPLFALVDEPPDWSQVIWPLLGGAGYFFGQLFTVLAIRAGDVSLQAPLMGVKVIFVAAYSFVLMPSDVPPLLWLASALTAIAVFLLGGASPKNFREAGKTILYALLACASYAVVDTLAGYRSAAFGTYPFMIFMTAILAVLSIFLLPFCHGRIREIPKRAWPGLLLGSIAMGAQAVILILGLAFHGQATLQNVIYSSRGLFGILLVWWVGHLLGNHERHTAGSAMMRRRLAGALLLCVAIGLVFLR